MEKERKEIKYLNNGFKVNINFLYNPEYPIEEVVSLINISLEKITNLYSAYGEALSLNFPLELLYKRSEFDKFFEYKTERWGSGLCRDGQVALFHPDFFEIETSHKREDFPKTLIHEISHMFDKKIFGENYLWWVHEGVAQYIANQTIFKKIKPENINHFIINNLYSNKNYRDFAQQLGHQISKRLVFAIADYYGESVLFEFLKIKPNKNSKQRFSIMLNVSQEKLEKKIRELLIHGEKIILNYQ